MSIGLSTLILWLQKSDEDEVTPDEFKCDNYIQLYLGTATSVL